jgi:hypothetical protein
MTDTRLTPGLIVLDKGLNLQAPKLTAPQGSVLDTLNYEQVDFQGQKRIDGFVRYDGSRLSDLLDYDVVVYTGTGTTFDTASVGDLLIGTNGLYGVLVGKNVGHNGDKAAAVAVIIPLNAPVVGVDDTYGATIVSVQSSTEYETDPTVQYDRLVEYNAVLKAKVEGLPGPVAGLHWFRDRLYAVASVIAASIAGTTPTIYPNDILLVGNAQYGRVLDAYTLDNTRLVFLDAPLEGSLTTDPESWQVEGFDVTRVPSVGSGGTSIGTIANGFEDLITDIASFFESRSEEQVLDEDGPSGPYDFGWRFKHLGWEVLFHDGISLYGSLPSTNQNIEGLGIQGPTSTTGNNGRPAILLQNVSISNKQAQVDGWKSTQTPTTYALDVDNITSIDGDCIYADAFLSWDGSTGAVSAPGITSSALVARPATATVEIELP